MLEEDIVAMSHTYPTVYFPEDCIHLEPYLVYTDKFSDIFELKYETADGYEHYTGPVNVVLVKSITTHEEENIEYKNNYSITTPSHVTEEIPDLQFLFYPEATGSNFLTTEETKSYLSDGQCQDLILCSPMKDLEVNSIISIENQSIYSGFESDSLLLDVFSQDTLLKDSIFEENELKSASLPNDNVALQQLMTPELHNVQRTRKTILFVGNDAEPGQTVEKITLNDPFMVCSDTADTDWNHYGAKGNDTSTNTVQTRASRSRSKSQQGCKRYQCNTCDQIFDNLPSFKQHMTLSHPKKKRRDSTPKAVKYCDGTNSYECQHCGKIFKTKGKFKNHEVGHGDPDRECPVCYKILCSKYSLKCHKKVHSKIPCGKCKKSFTNRDKLSKHSHRCNKNSSTITRLLDEETLDVQRKSPSITSSSKDSGFDDDLIVLHSRSEVLDITEQILQSTEATSSILEPQMSQSIQEADTVIAKVMANDFFLKTTKHYTCSKTCNVCLKSFSRIGDLKRHLIEHILRSTLSKNPVSEDGRLHLQCQLCTTESFASIDKYKAHLRVHAKLTIYKCTVCDRSFSDSSNFSKHKKVHGGDCFTCDLCNRKFNTKKMLSQHIEYHNRTEPLTCQYCDRTFHFKSTLNKHIKFTHSNEPATRYHCKFCDAHFTALKEKWDHEWLVHKMRNVIADCQICGSRFRKHSDLKRHVVQIHSRRMSADKQAMYDYI